VNADKRLIEAFVPLAPISQQSKEENSVTKATEYLPRALLTLLHRWWARRPLSACRAAVYCSLVPAPTTPAGLKREAEFVTRLCRWKASAATFTEARQKILTASGATAPRTLDLFAGGGSIPLEAARLGCESHAVELNPVAHLVQLATLYYPAKFGAKLLPIVKQWSDKVFSLTAPELEACYPTVRPPKDQPMQATFVASQAALKPSAYIWTRTVPCRRPDCGAAVPLHRQLWLRKKRGGFIALKPRPNKSRKRVY